MFGFRTKAKPSGQVGASDGATPPKSKTDRAKSYVMGVAATSQRLMRKQSSQPAPTTPENQVVSILVESPAVSGQYSPDEGLDALMPLVNPSQRGARNQHQYPGINTPPSSGSSRFLKRCLNINESDAECVFCSVGLNFALETEPVYKLQCGHYSHDQCLRRLDGSLKEVGNFDVLCSVCERPATAAIVKMSNDPDSEFVSASNFSPGFRHGISTPVSNGVAGCVKSANLFSGSMPRSAAPLHPSMKRDKSSFAQALSIAANKYQSNLEKSQSSTGLLSPMHDATTNAGPSLALQFIGESDSASVSTGRATLDSGQSTEEPQLSNSSQKTTISGNHPVSGALPSSSSSSTYPEIAPSPMGVSARKELKSLLSSEHAFVVECSPRMHSFHIVTVTDQPRQGTTRILVAIQPKAVASAHDILTTYRFSAKDIQYSTKIRKMLAGMKFDFGSIPLAELTALRLHSHVSVFSPESSTLHWTDCEAYLFDDLILIMRGSGIAAAVPLNKYMVKANVEESRPKVVELKLNQEGMVDLNLVTSSSAIAHMWKHAFADSMANFPLASGETFDSYICTLENYLENDFSPKLNPFVPSEIILCLPVNSQSQVLAMQQTVRAAVNSLSHQDKLGLILFSKFGVEHKISLSEPYSKVWVKALETIKIDSEPCSSPYDLDSVLSAACDLLEKHRCLDTTASVILVCDGDVTLQSISRKLLQNRVPVHTVGLLERHDGLTLSMLAQSSMGSYHYVKSNRELDELLLALAKLETRYTHKNVAMRFKPRISTKIASFIGGHVTPSMESIYSSAAQSSPIHMLENEPSILEWRIGSMRMDDIRELIIEVHGDVPSGSNILQVGLEATHVLSPDDTACNCMFRIPTRDVGCIVDERLTSMLFVSNITQAVLPELEHATTNLVLERTRIAYDQFLSGLQQLQSMQRTGLVVSRPFIALLEAYQWLFDSCCDEIVNHSQRTREFMLEVLQRIWVAHTKISILRRDPMECVYYDGL